MVQCPCCGRGDRVEQLMEREVPHPGGVYDHVVSSPGKGMIENEIVPVKDPEVTKELVKRCKTFLKAQGER
jgi:hypothetical protein